MANDANVNEQTKSLHYTHSTIGEMHERLFKMILKTQYGRNPELDTKIAAVWAARFGRKFRPMRRGEEAPLPLLHGPSAVGKSRIIEAVCRDVAEALDLNLLINPKSKRRFGPDDMVVGKLNFKASGDLPFMLTGMISINDEKDDAGQTVSYTKMTPNDIVHAVSEAGNAGVRVLFVDEVNSGDVASAAFMALNDNDLGADINLAGTFMVGAGNLGEADGNIASANPVSMSTRAWNFMVGPELKNWLESFVQPAYLSDPIGDFGVSVYLRLNPDKFNEKSPSASEIDGVSTLMGSPRTWSQLITTLEQQYDEPSALAELGVTRVQNICTGIVGPAGVGFAEFAYALWQGVTPLVENFMSEKGPSADTIKEFNTRQGQAKQAEQQEFLYQWVYQASLTAAAHIINGLDAAGIEEFDLAEDKIDGGKKTETVKNLFRDVGERYGRTLSGVKLRPLTNSAMAEIVNDMSRMTNRHAPWLTEEGGVRGTFRSAFLHGVFDEMSRADHFTKEQMEDMSNLFFGNKLTRENRRQAESGPSQDASKKSTIKPV